MMNFWKQRNPNNITEKPPHYRSKSDGGAVLLYLDFLTVLEGEADIVSAVSRSTPTQSQRNRIFFETVKWILSALPFFLYIWTPTCLCAIQRFHRAACAGTVQIWKGLGFPNKHFATQNGLCIYEDTACWSCTFQLSPPQNVSYFGLHSNCAFLSNNFLRCCQSGMSVVRIA